MNAKHVYIYMGESVCYVLFFLVLLGMCVGESELNLILGVNVYVCLI